MKSVKDRLSEAVQAVAPPGQKYSYLVALSEEISESNWKSAISGKQRPTAEMLEVFCKKHPELINYVITGSSENAVEQTSPTKINLLKNRKSTLAIWKAEPKDWSEEDFHLLDLLFREEDGLKDNEKQAFESAYFARGKKMTMQDFFMAERKKCEVLIKATDDPAEKMHLEHELMQIDRSASAWIFLHSHA